jgi:nucleoid DNA-binding protein
MPSAQRREEGKTMTKAELIGRVASKKDLPRDLTKKTVARIIDVVFTEIGDYFIRSRPTRTGTRTAPPRFSYPGFGTFTKRRRGARIVRNPQNGAPISLAAQSTIVFSPGQELKGLLNRDARATATHAALSNG